MSSGTRSSKDLDSKESSGSSVSLINARRNAELLYCVGQMASSPMRGPHTRPPPGSTARCSADVRSWQHRQRRPDSDWRLSGPDVALRLPVAASEPPQVSTQWQWQWDRKLASRAAPAANPALARPSPAGRASPRPPLASAATGSGSPAPPLALARPVDAGSGGGVRPTHRCALMA